MKVYENILRFYYGCARFDYDSIPDDEIRAGLKGIIDAIVPLRKDKELSISTYLEEREKLSFASHLPKVDPFGIEPDIDWRDIDLAMIIVIYEDRHSFGHLYWYLLSQFEKSDLYYRCYSKDYSDPEAPYKQGLIEYAIDFDLENTVKKYQSLSNPDERYEYVASMLRLSQQEVLVSHPIKDEYESKLSVLIEGCLEVFDKETPGHIEASTTPSPEEDNRQTVARNSTLRSYITHKTKNPDELLSFLHDEICCRHGQEALVYLQAAINAKLLIYPTYPKFIKEFGTEVCGRSTYHDHIVAHGGGIFNEKLMSQLDELTEELIRRFKRTDT